MEVPVRYSPLKDDETIKWFSFDREHCAHNDSRNPSVVGVQTNSALNALRVYEQTGLCVCPACWGNLFVVVGLTEPNASSDTLLIFEPSATAMITRKPAMVA